MVDPKGDAWFENKAGDIHYDSQLSGDTPESIGAGWSYLGPNNMFTAADPSAEPTPTDIANNPQRTDNTLLQANKKLTNQYDDIEGTTATFTGKNAVAFMESVGFKQVPAKEKVYSETQETLPYTISQPRAHQTYTFTTGTEITYNIESTYIPKSYILINKKLTSIETEYPKGQNFIDAISGTRRTTSVYENTYGPRTGRNLLDHILTKQYIGDFLKAYGGSHNYVHKYSIDCYNINKKEKDAK
jgi:hypothetical protein